MTWWESSYSHSIKDIKKSVVLKEFSHPTFRYSHCSNFSREIKPALVSLSFIYQTTRYHILLVFPQTHIAHAGKLLDKLPTIGPKWLTGIKTTCRAIIGHPAAAHHVSLHNNWRLSPRRVRKLAKSSATQSRKCWRTSNATSPRGINLNIPPEQLIA